MRFLPPSEKASSSLWLSRVLPAARGAFGRRVGASSRPGTEAGPVRWERGVLGAGAAGTSLRAPSCVTSRPGWEALQLVSFADEGAEPQGWCRLPVRAGARLSLPERSSASHDSATWSHWTRKALVTSSGMRASRDCCSEAPAPSWVALGSCVQNEARCESTREQA